MFSLSILFESFIYDLRQTLFQEVLDRASFLLQNAVNSEVQIARIEFEEGSEQAAKSIQFSRRLSHVAGPRHFSLANKLKLDSISHARRVRLPHIPFPSPPAIVSYTSILPDRERCESPKGCFGRNTPAYRLARMQWPLLAQMRIGRFGEWAQWEWLG